VSEAQVLVDGAVVGEIGAGILALVAAGPGDEGADCEALADKMVGLRIFPDDDGKMNLGVADVGGSVLLVSQFTLLADVRRGRRPSFTGSAAPEEAEPLVDRLAAAVRERGVPCETGRFGARMEVRLVNEGPVTLVLDVAGGRVQ
jgi:D-tyrosyl-tRNA(Tyr) deacylase